VDETTQGDITMLMLLTPLLGLLGSAVPALINLFQKKQELQHELQMAELKSKQIVEQGKVDMAVANINADADEGKSLRSHDASIDGGKFVNALRGSIRPVITYVFFGLFIAVKVSAAYVMFEHGKTTPDILKAVWDSETQALFATVITFWFGSRVFEKAIEDKKGKKK
jgi:hypothetical protein